jgi:pimeloyl-ACP methyl ester carboxylesterase
LVVEEVVSSIVTEQGIVHYQSIGRGQPIILLHGWINSWDVWRDAMVALAASGNYRLYALDFWGFGDSATRHNGNGNGQGPEPSFRVGAYVEMVRQFMDALGIHEAPIVGHSMGGTVALQFALRHPERVTKVAIVGSPINGSTLNPFLKLAGYGAIADLIWRFPALLRMTMHVLLAGDSARVRDMIFRDVKRTTLDSFFRSIGDLRDTDLRAELPALRVPALGIYGAKDNIVSPQNARLLANTVRLSEVAVMERSRHFPMTDEPDRFIGIMARFLTEAGEAAYA